MNIEDKAVPIRVPATANLMLDSADRNEAVNPNPFDFSISRPNSLLNGFFTRIGTTEVVLEWNEPNGSVLVNDPYTLERDGLVSTFSGAHIFGQIPGFYNVSTALEAIKDVFLNDMNEVVDIAQLQNGVSMYATNFSSIAVSTSAVQMKKLGLETDALVPYLGIRAPDIRPYRYIDFTSQQLTYNQDLKDSSTAPLVKDVLCRWYFDWDTPPQLDELGFPIDMGYTPFKLRRIFNPPKQIKWDARQPIGQLAFQVYGDNEQSVIPLNDPPSGSEWLMTLQVSEN